VNKATLIVLSLMLHGCVGPAPIDDYNLTRTAMDYAREKGAPQTAPGFWAKAEELYSAAVADYENKEYDSAKLKFVEAKKMAEKAENYTVLKKAEAGDAE
jgi:hypothetical protein